jgi:cobalt-zinc-cadmium efflux system membrane fusion protein
MARSTEELASYRRPRRRSSPRLLVVLGGVAAAAAVGVAVVALTGRSGTKQEAAAPPAIQDARPSATAAAPLITLTERQMQQLRVGKVELQTFGEERNAFGQITLNEDLTTPVYPPYAGRILRLHLKPGDPVSKGDLMFEIDSPDLVQAEGSLITAAGALVKAKSQLDLATRTLARQRELFRARATAQKDVEQAESGVDVADSDYRAAVGALAAARDAVRIFGKTEPQIARIQEQRRIDPVLPVYSPFEGTVVARKAGPGQLVQPSNPEPVYVIADLSRMWLVASVPELEIPAIHLGDQVEVKVAAYPKEVFRARITNIGAMVDPATRRVAVRSELETKGYQLKAQMFASFRIVTAAAAPTPAVPASALVRDVSTATVWVLRGPRQFEARRVERGVEKDGMVQVLSGLVANETIVVEGAVFLSNASGAGEGSAGKK